MPALDLERIGAAPFAPAPRAVRAGDYVFTSSIYPIDEAGHAVAVDSRLGEAGPSLMEAQARRCLETLKSVLRDSGSSLERVLKADVHLADAAEFPWELWVIALAGGVATCGRGPVAYGWHRLCFHDDQEWC